MGRSRTSKRDCQLEHFQKRCMERMGYLMKQRTLKEMMENGELRFLEKQSNRVSLWILPRKWSNPFIFLYDKARKCFLTVLTYDMYVQRKRNMEVNGTWRMGGTSLRLD